MAYVYILYSPAAKRFYIGSCLELSDRLNEHRDKKHAGSFTARYSDWELYFTIADLSYLQARKVEQHIKKMKSRKYIENLVLYPEIAMGLIERYKSPF
ncbi:GIY-YIG nuclease family protein [Niabella beijingensis]|uniref:GIY-YIG nuclease family protein n=1 Tax=Niabella beijingensis TaxID=2872700 RepID=UPI001CBFFBF5|nr:GIY-YIG nuclease family protein [Niabella beijingensis]MBZ4187989.1 GIY-YIG nuclease family protein [Niabella beijingensis]